MDKLKKLIVSLFVLLVTVHVYGQGSNAHRLCWKMNDNDTVYYKTVMQDIDAGKHHDELLNLRALISANSSTQFITGLKSMMNNVRVDQLSTYMFGRGNSVIDIEMYSDTSTNYSDTVGRSKESQQYFKMLNEGPRLRGSIYASGSIRSFYLKTEQKNLLALFFQLPDQPVRVGDNWPLDIQLISMDQNFECDSSFADNHASLIGIQNENGDSIATIKYKFEESVSGQLSIPSVIGPSYKKTILRITFDAIGAFNIKKGCWISYDGIMSITSSGVVKQNKMRILSLEKE
jgi:hypothetical protein